MYIYINVFPFFDSLSNEFPMDKNQQTWTHGLGVFPGSSCNSKSRSKPSNDRHYTRWLETVSPQKKVIIQGGAP